MGCWPVTCLVMSFHIWINYTVETYEDGRRKARRAEVTSDIQTEDEDDSKRPVR